MPRNRLRRTELVSSALSVDKMRKGLFETNADQVVFDLEDSVPDSHKDVARKNIVEVLEGYAKHNGKTISIRINALDTDFWYEDLRYIILRSCKKIDCVIVPKVENPSDIQIVDKALKELEDECGADSPIGLEALIETAKGILYCRETAFSSPRLESLIFGPVDYAASIGISAVPLMKDIDDYAKHAWYYPLLIIRIASAAAGLQAIDGPYIFYKDLDGLHRAAKLSRNLGFEGKWVIHPSQIEICNQIYSPSKEEIEWARRIVMAYEKGLSEATGVVSVGDLMVDKAIVRIAQRVLEYENILSSRAD